MDCVIVLSIPLATLQSLYLSRVCLSLCVRDPSIRVLYIDDALIASTIRLDFHCAKLLPTEGPHGRLGSCGLGLPGGWFQLEHRLRDVDANARDVGMVLNTKKTTMIIFNTRRKQQCIPFCSLIDGQPLPVVSEMRLLGLILDDHLTWWPLVNDVVKRSRAKIWSVLKLREAGASEEQLLSLYIWSTGHRCLEQ